MKFFIEEPEKEFYVREIARKLEKSPTTISKYLKDYEKDGVLISEKKFNHLLFKANLQSGEFKQIKLSYNLKILKSSGIIEYLSKEFNNPEAIVLFGSFVKGENIKKSDIDLLIITSLKKELNLEKFENKLGYKVQLFTASRKEITEMKEKNKELLNSWINGITLYGYLEVFK